VFLTRVPTSVFTPPSINGLLWTALAGGTREENTAGFFFYNIHSIQLLVVASVLSHEEELPGCD
jgi:hypothetical protein